MPNETAYRPVLLYRPGSCCDDEFAAQGIVANTPEEFAQLEQAGFVTASDYLKPQAEREATARQRAAEAAAEAAAKAAEEDKRSKAAREQAAAEAKAKSEAEAQRLAQLTEQQNRDAFLVRAYRAQMDSLNERRSRIRVELSRICAELSGGWNSELALRGVELDRELETISSREAETERQLAAARAEERKQWQKSKQ